MPFEWNESKRSSNLAKYGIDFKDAERFFNAEPICFEDFRQNYNEKRFIAFGKNRRTAYNYGVYATEG